MCFEFKHKYVQVPTKWTIKRICLWMIGWNFSAPIKVLDMLLLCTPHVRERSHICWWTFFVINPQRSARPTSLLWRLSVSETGIVDRADQSSYHTLRQIAHGLFGGGLAPFWDSTHSPIKFISTAAGSHKHQYSCFGNLKTGRACKERWHWRSRNNICLNGPSLLDTKCHWTLISTTYNV